MRFYFRSLLVGLLLSIIIGTADAAPSKYRWKKNVITISVSSALTTNTVNFPPNADASATIDRSIASWQHAANISFRKSVTTEQSVSPPGMQGDSISLITIAATPENIAMFPKGLDDAAARTRVFYDARGFIIEADIVLNPFLQFSTDGTIGTFDLESTITHEVGHLLGLGHSHVLGATMNENNGRNGVYNLPAFNARTLAADDVAAIRTLYGPPSTDGTCCGRISGRLVLQTGKPAPNFVVWAEDADDGQLLAAAVTAADGSFRIGGLTAGKIDLRAQGESSDFSTLSSVGIGSFLITPKQTVNVLKKLESINADLSPEYVGFNGQLSSLAVSVNSGGSYNILLGGSNFGNGNLRVGSSSPDIVFSQKPGRMDFGDSAEALSFEIFVAPDTPAGEYSVFVQSETGERRYLLGALTVENVPNLWSTTNYK